MTPSAFVKSSACEVNMRMGRRVSRQETHRDVGSGGLNLALRRVMPANARVREQRILNELPSQTL
jgi:predicted RNA-binding protein (virulence factor B family)